MKRKLLRVMVCSLIAMLSMGSIAYAAASTTKEYTVTTQREDYSSLSLADLEKDELEQIRKELRIDGKKYKAVDVKISEISHEKPMNREKEFFGLTSKEVPKTLKLKNGEKLKLKDVKWTEQRRNAATGTTTFTGTNTKPNAPATKEITASLPDGSTITVTGRLQSIEKTGSSYSKPFTVTAKFTGDEDVSYYKLGSTKIPNNPKSPTFDGYETVLLQHLGFNPEECRITSGKWTSDYLQEDGNTVRYAEFSGMKSAADWTAYYTETVTADSPQVVTYDAVATYSNGVENPTYELLVTVAYSYEGLSLLQKILIATAGIAVVALATAAILMILGKKKKKNEKAQG